MLFNFDKKSETVIAFCALVVSLVAVFVSIIQVGMERRLKNIEALIILNEHLHEPIYSEARKYVRYMNGDPHIDNEHVHAVCSSFDFAAFMIHKGHIDEKEFIEYWVVPLKIIDSKFNDKFWKEKASNITSEEATVADYYKDFKKLLETSRKYKAM